MSGSAVEQARALVGDGGDDWLGLVALLRTSDDPAVMELVGRELERRRLHEAMATEDRWMAEMAFEKIHGIFRPAATVVPNYRRRVSDRRYTTLVSEDTRYALVAVLPLLLPLRRAVAVAVSVIAMESGTSMAPWQLGRSGFELRLLPAGHGYPYAVFDTVEAGAYVPVTFEGYLDLVPGALSGEGFGDDVWARLDAMSEEALSDKEVRHTGSRLGGYRAFNAQFVLEEAFCDRCRASLWYAVHLSADIFGDTFGESASLHVLVCPKGCEAKAMLDGA